MTLWNLVNPGYGPIALNEGVGWSPSNLGASLLAWWTADRSDLITQSGGLVSNWRDAVGSYDLAEVTSKPAYSATGFAGQPGIVIDGVYLTLASQPFPSGSDPSEIWAVVQQDADPSDTSTRVIASYGGSALANRRDLYRTVVTGVNRGGIQFGRSGGTSAANNSIVNLSTRHVMRGAFTAASHIDVDGNASVAGLAVASTGTTRFRVGATANDAPGSPWKGVIRDLFVTGPLNAEQEASFLAYLLSRRLV